MCYNGCTFCSGWKTSVYKKGNKTKVKWKCKKCKHNEALRFQTQELERIRSRAFHDKKWPFFRWKDDASTPRHFIFTVLSRDSLFGRHFPTYPRHLKTEAIPAYLESQNNTWILFPTFHHTIGLFVSYSEMINTWTNNMSSVLVIRLHLRPRARRRLCGRVVWGAALETRRVRVQIPLFKVVPYFHSSITLVMANGFALYQFLICWDLSWLFLCGHKRELGSSHFNFWHFQLTLSMGIRACIPPSGQLA